jgi:hypothetical protein
MTTLHEYRMRYPDSAAIPTLTQSGLLGLLLDRQRHKAANLARRRAMWRSVCAAPRKVFGERLPSLNSATPLTAPTSQLDASLKPLP